MRSTLSKKNKIVFIIGICILLVIYFFNLILIPPALSTFPTNETISIDDGQSLFDISKKLENEGAIKSGFWFRNIVIMLKKERSIMSGDYIFSERLNMIDLAKRMINGEFGPALVRVTIPEGLNTFQIAEILNHHFPDFDVDSFIEEALTHEGYLFPDTYFFRRRVTSEEIISTMRKNFDVKMSNIYDEINDFDKDIEEIIIMASLIEGEARTAESRRMISGILWHRLAIGMPLQVDAVFPYIIGKNTYELTLEDLAVDSPYNTYLYTGLPVGPILNPSLDSILATIQPIESEYIYYLSDRAGNMYYAKTFDEHIKNRRYLDRE